MVFNYAMMLPSTHIYQGMETLNHALARATLEAYQSHPTDRFMRVTHAANLYAKTGFLSGASSGQGCLVQTGLVCLLSNVAAPVATVLPVALAEFGYLLTDPILGCLAVAEAVFYAGVGPRSSACARAAGRALCFEEAIFQYGFTGILEYLALDKAESSAQAGRTSISYAAYACAFGVALVFEPVRAPLACVLVVVRLMSACLYAATYAVIGASVAVATREPTAQHWLFDPSVIQRAADLVGVANPAHAARDTQSRADAVRATQTDRALEAYTRDVVNRIASDVLGSPPSYDPPAYGHLSENEARSVFYPSLSAADVLRQPPPPYER